MSILLILEIFIRKHFNILLEFEKKLIFLHILKVEHKIFPMMYHLSYLEIKLWI